MMAKAAKGGNVSADMKPVDYRGAVKRLGTIDQKKSKQQAAAKEIGDVYSAVEGIHGVCKPAAKIFMALRKLDTNDLRTAFRDLNGLLDAAGILEEDADLADKAEGTTVVQRFPVIEGGAGKAPVEEDDEGGIDEEIEDLSGDAPAASDDEFEEATEEELAAQKGRQEAREAKSVIGAGAKKGDPEPYTGDNSDLAKAAE